MRRQAKSQTAPAKARQEEGAAGEAKDAPEESLMRSILRDPSDTCSGLQMLQASLEASLEALRAPLVGFGGARHPTTIMTTRAIAVVRRKVALLRAAEGRATQVQAALRSAKAMRQLLLRTDQPPEAALAEAPEELRVAFEALHDIKGFIADLAHKNGGDPAEARKMRRLRRLLRAPGEARGPAETAVPGRGGRGLVGPSNI
jgi:hypothetical protein